MIRVLPLWTKRDQSWDGAVVVNTCSSSDNWSRGLSPFVLGPVKLYDGHVALNVENGWQFSKVYEEFTDKVGAPSDSYWRWATAGWNNPKAVRYPMGKGRRPLYSWWRGCALTYVEARKRVYCRLYSRAVERTQAFKRLKTIHASADLILLDYDAYDHRALGITYKDVLNNPDRKMGHAFVLAMMLEGRREWC
jgi:hypothetical protein